VNVSIVVVCLIVCAYTGEITLKEILPVTQLYFGKTSYTGGSHTLGKLECVGKSSADLPIPTSCLDLWRIGHVLKGLHPVRKGKKVQLVYCDFSLGYTTTSN
jgi:hypothetical protein